MLVEEMPIESTAPCQNNPRRNVVDAGVRSIREDGADDEGRLQHHADAGLVNPSTGKEERWVAVPGYEGLYEVSDHGRVRRASASRMAPAGHVLKPKLSWDGYVQYGLCKRQRYWHVKGHRLVALAFLGPPPSPRLHVAHYDGDKTNNRLANLRWVTPAENEADKRRHGRVRGARPGEQHPGAKLTVELVCRMREMAGTGCSSKAVARHFGVAYLTAYDAIHGLTWGTVTQPPPVPRRRKGGAA